MISPPDLLRALFNAALAAANPAQVLAAHLPVDRSGPLRVVGAGKAAASMAAALESAWAGPVSGLVVTRYGHGMPCRHIEVIEASHPLPDTHGVQAAQRMLACVSARSAHEQIICLLSGGGSALLTLPASGVTLAHKQHINHQLLRSGATISEINCVRKHLSAIKGGRLAAACTPADLLTLAISDVPGDDASVIASGPTVADPTCSADALAILQRYTVDTPHAVREWLGNSASETLKPGDARLARSRFRLIATPKLALQAAAQAARDAGIVPLLLGADLQGEARDVARKHADIALGIRSLGAPVKPPCVILSGGETSVSMRGNGRGGRNSEYLLALAVALQGAPGIHALACDTDGIDGSEDNAGAYLAPSHWQTASGRNLNPRAMLDNNDSYGFFAALHSLVVTGPTRTNVNDFRAILVMPT